MKKELEKYEKIKKFEEAKANGEIKHFPYNFVGPHNTYTLDFDKTKVLRKEKSNSPPRSQSPNGFNKKNSL